MYPARQKRNASLVILLSLLSAGRISAQQPAVSLLTTSALTSLPDGSYQAVLSLQNTGSAMATSVWISTASLGSASGLPSAVALPAIAAGTTAQATISFSPAAGSPGTPTIERFAGTYDGGTFGESLRVVLPPPSAPAATVTATIDPTQPSRPIPDHFMGFSMDSNVVDTYVGGTTVANPILVNLINNFTPFNGIPTLRLLPPRQAPPVRTSQPSFSPR